MFPSIILMFSVTICYFFLCILLSYGKTSGLRVPLWIAPLLYYLHFILTSSLDRWVTCSLSTYINTPTKNQLHHQAANKSIKNSWSQEQKASRARYWPILPVVFCTKEPCSRVSGLLGNTVHSSIHHLFLDVRTWWVLKWGIQGNMHLKHIPAFLSQATISNASWFQFLYFLFILTFIMAMMLTPKFTES